MTARERGPEFPTDQGDWGRYRYGPRAPSGSAAGRIILTVSILSSRETRLPKPVPEPLPPEVAAAFHDAALAVHERTGSARLARRAGLGWATAVAAELAAGHPAQARVMPARPRFAIGGEATVEGHGALDRLLAEAGWDPADGRGVKEPGLGIATGQEPTLGSDL